MTGLWLRPVARKGRAALQLYLLYLEGKLLVEDETLEVIGSADKNTQYGIGNTLPVERLIWKEG